MSIMPAMIRTTPLLRAMLMLSSLLLTASLLHANVTLSDIIGDSMVLQRDHVIPIWGKADAAEVVQVHFGHQTKKTTADQDGQWRITLYPLRANSTPATMTITGKNTIELKNILVGEVWLVSGQSNMQFTLAESKDGDAAVAAADHPLIRLFNVSRQVAFGHRTGPLGTWQASTPASAKEFSAAGYYFGVELEKELHVPVGLIDSSYGGSQAEAWTPIEYLRASDDLRPCIEREKIWEEERPRVKAEYEKQMQQWRADLEKAKASGAPPPSQPRVPDALREYRIAASIYDRMIAPLIPFAMRGAFWYQGESNEGRAQQYEILLSTMIKAWRERWGEGDFPFGIIQLPNFHDLKPEPFDDPWSFLREAQRRTTVKTPKTGLIVTIDIGEAHNGHPKDKLDIGKRMCRWALADVYRRKITKSGPMLRDAKISPGRIIITFDGAGDGLRTRDNGKLSEFAIAGPDHRWRWAEARIVGKDRVEVWSDAVPRPEAVRYAFNSNPQNANLTNETNLPATPFRTDNWPGPTDGKR
jgi:sialate O-acetylesterase